MALNMHVVGKSPYHRPLTLLNKASAPSFAEVCLQFYQALTIEVMLDFLLLKS